MPKTPLQDLAKYPYSMNDHNLIYLPKSVSLISTSPCFDTQRQVLQFMYKSLFARKQENQCTREMKIPKKWIKVLEELDTRQESGEKLNIDSIWANEFPNRQQLYNKLGTSEDCFVIKESQLKEFYISVLFSLMKMDRTPSERLLMNLFDQGGEEELARYRVPLTDAIDSPHSDYRHLFQKLSPENIVTIMKCMLLEKKIIFFSATPGDIPYITEALLGLLSPM